MNRDLINDYIKRNSLDIKDRYIEMYGSFDSEQNPEFIKFAEDEAEDTLNDLKALCERHNLDFYLEASKC